MSAWLLIEGVRASLPPDADPLAAVAETLYQSLYSPMSPFYMRSLQVLHGLFAVQTLLFIVSLVIRWRRHRSDLWLFRITSTARGRYITPHFAVAWQACTILALVVFQAYLASVTQHAVGNDWPGYLGGRSMGFLPVWLSTWLALWSLAVAVSIPLARWNVHGRLGALSSPRAVNSHFIAGLVLCPTSIIVSSVLYNRHYQMGIDHYRHAVAILGASSSAALTRVEVDAVFSEVAPLIDEMQASLACFPYYFKIAWGLWSAWILYSYTVFIGVSISYFSYIKWSMKRVEGLAGDSVKRTALDRAWTFSVLTSVLITCLGAIYAGTSLYLTIWTSQALLSKRALEVETLVSLYGLGILGLLAGALAVAQSLLGSAASTSAAASSQITSIIKALPSQTSTLHVEVQRTVVHHVDETDNVVQLELADWHHEQSAEERKSRWRRDM